MKQQPKQSEEQLTREVVRARDRRLIAFLLPKAEPSSAAAAYSERDATEALGNYRFSDPDTQRCAACAHWGLRHAEDGCQAGKKGMRFRNTGYPARSRKDLVKSGEMCWCPKYVSDPLEGRELRLKYAGPEVLKAEAIDAIQQRDPILARRAYHQYLNRTSRMERDVAMLSGLDLQIRALEDEGKKSAIARKSSPIEIIAHKVSRPDLNPTLTPEETALYLGISRSSVYRYCDEGKLSRADAGKLAGKRSKFLVRTESINRFTQAGSE